MSEENICPCCGRHCDLSMPQCGRGEEYRRTGEMPQRRHGEGHRQEMRMEHYRAADINDKLIINLRDMSHIMRLLYEGKASQKRILIILNELGTVTQRDLTERLGIQPGSASEILSKLEGAGLILRVQNEADRRTTDIRLTDSGRELASEALAQRQKRHKEMFSCLSEEEKQELLSLLERVCGDWRKRYCENGRPHGHGCGEDGRGRRHGGHGYHNEDGHHRNYDGHEQNNSGGQRDSSHEYGGD